MHSTYSGCHPVIVIMPSFVISAFCQSPYAWSKDKPENIVRNRSTMTILYSTVNGTAHVCLALHSSSDVPLCGWITPKLLPPIEETSRM